MRVRNQLNILLQKLTGYKLISKDLDIHLQLILDEKYGHQNSRISKQSIDENGRPVPWITYPAFEYLHQFDLSEKEIFEWGSGNSSLYFASRCRKITCIETKQDWLAEMRLKRTENMVLEYSDPDEAAEKIKDFEESFDLIFIDSSTNRLACAQQAIHKVKKGGLIILDNAARHVKAAEYLKAQGYLQIDMHGMGPIVKSTWTTSFFMDRTFDWKIKANRQPSYSKAAVPGTVL